MANLTATAAVLYEIKKRPDDPAVAAGAGG
jgi:hypothetical protein